MDRTSLPMSLIQSLKRHRWVALSTLASAIGASGLYLQLAAPQYETSLRVIVDKNSISVSDLGQTLTDLYNNSATGVNPLATQVELIKSEQVLGQALDQVRATYATSDEIPTVDELRKNLAIQIVPATNILEISYLHPDPKLAAQILNSIAESAVEESARSIRLEASSVRQFLETKIPQQQVRLSRAEVAEQKYREANGIVSLEAQAQSLVDSLSGLRNDERSLMSQLQEATERSRLLYQLTGVDTLRQAYGVVRVGQDENLNQLRQNLTDIEAQLAAARSRLGDRHPDLLALLEQRQSLRTLYAEALQRLTGNANPTQADASNELSQTLIAQYITGEIERQALQQRLGVIQSNQVVLNQQAAQLPRQQQALATLTRQREEAETTLKLLQGKLEEARIAEAQLVSNVQIVGLADTPEEPASPSTPAVLILGTVAGFLLSLGSVFLLEMLDRTVHSAAELEAALGLPVLGTLPKLPSQLLQVDRIETFLDDATRIEPYRVLLRTLEAQCLSQSGSQPANQNSGMTTENTPRRTRTIVVSSALLGEGKSAVAIYLSAVAAMLSRRVLLIDTDLRQPTQSRFFGLPPHPGLTEVIHGEATLHQAVQSSGIERLSLLSQGRYLSRPSTLSETPAMQKLLTQAKAEYDWIVVDTPASTGSADAAALSQYADGLVLVVRPNFAPLETLRQAVDALRKSGTPILGVILNETTIPEEMNVNPPIPLLPSMRLPKAISPDTASDKISQR